MITVASLGGKGLRCLAGEWGEPMGKGVVQRVAAHRITVHCGSLLRILQSRPRGQP